MSLYYVDNSLDENGRHIVHEEGCTKIPDEFSVTYIGEHFSDVEAVEFCVKNFYSNCDGCCICCVDGHFK